jgi:hypothetical protein
MKYFGDVNCADAEKIPIPVNEMCFYCGELIELNDSGVAVPHIGLEGTSIKYRHIECFARNTFGSYGHLTKQCSCYGGNLEDPPSLSKRKAAKLAFITAKYLENK